MAWNEWQSIADDEAHWAKHQERGLLKVEHLRDFVLRLWFEEAADVAIYNLDFRPLVVDNNPGGVFALLKNPAYFRLAVGDCALVWPNPRTGAFDENVVDLAPECARFFSKRCGELVEPPRQYQLEQMAA